jgi:hypothetical protein
MLRGLILSLVFQLAHIIEDAQMPLPDKKDRYYEKYMGNSPTAYYS